MRATTAIAGLAALVSFAVENQMNRIADVLGLDSASDRLNERESHRRHGPANSVTLKDPATGAVVLDARAARSGYDLPAGTARLTTTGAGRVRPRATRRAARRRGTVGQWKEGVMASTRARNREIRVPNRMNQNGDPSRPGSS